MRRPSRACVLRWTAADGRSLLHELGLAGTRAGAARGVGDRPEPPNPAGRQASPLGKLIGQQPAHEWLIDLELIAVHLRQPFDPGRSVLTVPGSAACYGSIGRRRAYRSCWPPGEASERRSASTT